VLVPDVPPERGAFAADFTLGCHSLRRLSEPTGFVQAECSASLSRCSASAMRWWWGDTPHGPRAWPFGWAQDAAAPPLLLVCSAMNCSVGHQHARMLAFYERQGDSQAVQRVPTARPHS
jgi:hypothetical protein